MSTAMTLLGYQALPNGADLIAREQQREAGQKTLKPVLRWPDFLFSISRSLEGPGDQEIELAIEVTHYREPGNNRGLDHRDPSYEAGEVEFGDAISVATGDKIALTQLEWDAVAEAFWGN